MIILIDGGGYTGVCWGPIAYMFLQLRTNKAYLLSPNKDDCSLRL